MGGCEVRKMEFDDEIEETRVMLEDELKALHTNTLRLEQEMEDAERKIAHSRALLELDKQYEKRYKSMLNTLTGEADEVVEFAAFVAVRFPVLKRQYQDSQFGNLKVLAAQAEKMFKKTEEEPVKKKRGPGRPPKIKRED